MAGAAVAADANRLTLLGDIRWTPDESMWGIAATLSADRHRQEATDRAARTATDITAWNSALSVEVTRALSTHWSYSAGIGANYYTPYATIPSLNARGASYRSLLAPAFEVAAAPSRQTALSVTLRRQRLPQNTALRLAWSSTSATRRALDAVYLPKGSRGCWSLTMSVSDAKEAR